MGVVKYEYPYLCNSGCDLDANLCAERMEIDTSASAIFFPIVGQATYDSDGTTITDYLLVFGAVEEKFP